MRRTLLIFGAVYIAVLTLILSCAHLYYNATVIHNYIAKYIPLHFLLIGGLMALSGFVFRFSKSSLRHDLKQVMLYKAEDRRCYSQGDAVIKFKVWEFIIIDCFLLPLFITAVGNCFLYTVFVL